MSNRILSMGARKYIELGNGFAAEIIGAGDVGLDPDVWLVWSDKDWDDITNNRVDYGLHVIEFGEEIMFDTIGDWQPAVEELRKLVEGIPCDRDVVEVWGKLNGFL